MPSVQVCFSPLLFPLISFNKPTAIVVIDILRATTAFCTAFDWGAETIIPLDSIDEAKKFKQQGMLVAAERDGLKPDFADFGNSSFDFMSEKVRNKTIYYTTTNGTKAIKMSETHGQVAIGSFLNLPALTEWLILQDKQVAILCAGWKDNYCIEDTICAGALTDLLERKGGYTLEGDSALTSLLLWQNNSNDLGEFIKKADHFKRLEKLGLDDILLYTLQIGKSESVPVLIDGKLININKSSNHPG